MHTPHIMRLHEMMGIESNRRWGVCSLNEFRKVMIFSTVGDFLMNADYNLLLVPRIEALVPPNGDL